MTPQDKIKVLAEMDGWTNIHDNKYSVPASGKTPPDWKGDGFSSASDDYILPNYPESRDAIVPLIVKWCGKSNERWHAFQMACAEVSQDWMNSYSSAQAILEMSPNQLADALIKAADMWKD